jgi:hypothetical protein
VDGAALDREGTEAIHPSRAEGTGLQQVAVRIHVHDSVFALWKAGKRAVPTRWIESLAAALEVPISLLARDGDLSME